MFTLKSLDVKTNSAAPIPGERLLLWVDAVFTNGKEDVALDFKIENKELMDATLRSIRERLNRRDAEKQEINVSGYQIPEVIIEEVELTPEQIKEQQIADKEREIKLLAIQKEEDAKYAELAKTEPELAQKLAELANLKR